MMRFLQKTKLFDKHDTILVVGEVYRNQAGFPQLHLCMRSCGWATVAAVGAECTYTLKQKEKP